MSIKRYMARIGVVFAGVAACAAVIAAPGWGSAGPVLRLDALLPETVTAGEGMAPYLAIQNVGNQATSGPLTISDTVSVGQTVPTREHLAVSSDNAVPSTTEGSVICQTSGATFTCVVPYKLLPGGQLTLLYANSVASDATGVLSNSFAVSGGGVVGVSKALASTTVGSPLPFGFSKTVAELMNGDESPTVRAGAVPANYTTRVRFHTFSSPSPENSPTLGPIEHFKDVTVNLPVGFVGNPTATPLQCTAVQLAGRRGGGGTYSNVPDCPDESQVGIVHIEAGAYNGGESWYTGLFNMVAPPGAATELGFNIEGVVVTLDAYVRPGDRGITVVSRDTSTTLPIFGADVTVWGVPGDKSHDPYRGACLESAYRGPNGLLCPVSVPRTAFLRMPTSCPGSPLALTATSNTYEHPDKYVESGFTAPAVSACDQVPFAPAIDVLPTATAASSPTGVSVRLSLPQSTNPDGIGEADLKKAVVRLPEGMAINPSAADGLEACSDAQLRVGLPGPAACPDGSKVGTVLLHTPLLSEPIEGTVYVLSQESGDPESGRMFRIGMELRNDQRGIDIKVPGQISADKTTGRLTTTFDDNPQLPFSDITLSFKAGARAPLYTPASCETQTTETDLYSWAEPSIPVHRSTAFALTEGPEHTPCVSVHPFNPVLDAGVGSVQAGGFTPFSATFKRSDADQSMQRVSVKMPQGLLGSLIGIPLCPEADANNGTCAAASEIGTVTAGAGAGPTPFYVTGGKVYMTGPYEGAPFGLSVVVPTKAGPYDLGNVIVRAKVEVDIHTAQLTVTTDPLPQIVSGVPVNLRLVNVTINRPEFTYNPTSCDPTTVTGTINGGQGATAVLSNHFQVTNCGALQFKPKFTVSTVAKTNRTIGASLDAKLSYPKNIGQANIARVKVSLPKQLPSRLTTLQKACTAQTFEANPAACPAASRIGTATANTPVLPVPLSGPVYFVSHGGQAFPDLVVVLQGYGVTVNLVGSTFINEKTNVTSTTFKTVPDVPVGTFELKLPQGRYSALAANGNLCQAKLKMPTAFIAQDGAEIHQSTKITVSGCARQKTKHTKTQAKHHKKH